MPLVYQKDLTRLLSCVFIILTLPAFWGKGKWEVFKKMEIVKSLYFACALWCLCHTYMCTHFQSAGFHWGEGQSVDATYAALIEAD